VPAGSCSSPLSLRRVLSLIPIGYPPAASLRHLLSSSGTLKGEVQQRPSLASRAFPEEYAGAAGADPDHDLADIWGNT